MKLMLKFWLSVICLFIITGCVETQYSEVLREDATVDETVFSPSQHGTTVGPVIGMNGNVHMAVTSTYVPENYGIVFHCKHGKFIVRGSDQFHKTLWSRLQRGDSVVVDYKEVYEVDKEAKTCRLVDFKFIDARKR
jgi:aspartate-semialdehyde dehydrogenase